MIDQPRAAGSLDLSDAIRARLAELRFLSGVDLPPELDLEAVRDTERAVGMHLPDEVLATFAARVPHLSDHHGFELGSVVAHTGTLRALGARGDYVGVGEDPDQARYWCVEKGRVFEETTLLVVEALASEAMPITLADLLDGVIRRLRAADPGAPAFDPGLAVTFAPRLVRPLPESAEGIRVRHKVFGEGFVLQELGTGPARKVKVCEGNWMKSTALSFSDSSIYEDAGSIT